jgi:Icc-related predicted phosphoesterase
MDKKILKIVCISDTHNRHKDIELPDGDILAVSGDFTLQGAEGEVERFNKWLGEIKSKYKHVIVTPGNHERTFDPEMKSYSPKIKSLLTNCTYLEHSWAVIEGLVIFGTPYSPEFCGWAFSNKSPGQAENRWKDIPDNTDVLISHGPPHGFGDVTGYENVGCRELFKRIMQVKPKLVISGHIHEGYGIRQFEGVTIVNASSCDWQYKPVNKPIIIELEVD